MKTQTVRFIVEGSGEFPLDMLRYDRCFPSSESGANTAQGLRDFRQVTLEREAAPVHWFPTEGRWKSFGWKLKKVEVVNDIR